MDTLQTIGAIVAFLLLLFQVFERVPRIRRFFVDSVHVVGKVRKMFREWRWWNKYCPRCEIVEHGDLKIEKIDSGYYMELPVDVRYTSRDSRHATRMDITTVLLDVMSTGKGRDDEPYRLSRTSLPLRKHPRSEEDVSQGAYPVTGLIWVLPSSSSVTIGYTFFVEVDALPLVNESATCKIVSVGRAKVEGVGESRPLRISNRFSVRTITTAAS